MAGNSSRRGAVRKGSSRKGASVGTGGQQRKSLQGKGPTPKAVERTGHPAAGRARSAVAPRGGTSRGAGGPRRTGNRAKPSTEVVAGRNSVVEALRADIPVAQLYVASRVDMDDRVREALKIASTRGLPILEVSRTDLDRLTDGAVHQGLALAVPPYAYAHYRDLLERATASGENALLVALDGVTDPRNLGAVVRSAAAFGGHGVLVPERRAAGMTAGAWKASAGAAARLPVARATNLTRALLELQEAGCVVVGLDAAGASPVSSLDVGDSPVVLVVGAEDKGVSRLVRQTCDVVAHIPMAAQTESLNAGVAAGIALYEIARSRGR